jgi:mannosyltransferase OCH1-like enzyme
MAETRFGLKRMRHVLWVWRRHPWASLAVVLLLCPLLAAYRSATQFSSAVHANTLSLQDFPASYVDSLNQTLQRNEVFDIEPIPDRQIIPRIIHRVYKDTDVPVEWRAAFQSCHVVNPSYQHYFWTDETARDFIQANFDWFLPTYDGYPYQIQRVDALRYFLLWHYGGVYMDMDIGCRLPLEPLLEVPVWFPRTWPYGVSNDLIASRPNHPFMIKVALSLQDHNRSYLSKYPTVFFTTGPMFVNQILSAWLRTVRDSLRPTPTALPGIGIIPSGMYDTAPYTFFDHFEGSSWHGNDVALLLFLYGHRWGLVLVVIPSVMVGVGLYHKRVKRQRRKYQWINERDYDA